MKPRTIKIGNSRFDLEGSYAGVSVVVKLKQSGELFKVMRKDRALSLGTDTKKWRKMAAYLERAADYVESL